MRASVLGAGGYLGGELLRLLTGHPVFTLAEATSQRYAGRAVSSVNPNLRGVTDLRFIEPEALGRCDILFAAMPHGAAAKALPELADRAGVVVDLSADFRLPAPDGTDWGRRFVPGIPELTGDRLRRADLISTPGCMANAAMLALLPLAAAGLLTGRAIVDGRTGSSGAGSQPGPASHHPVRSGAMRVYAPGRHRHRLEIAQVLGVPVDMTATAVEAVRGVQVVCHARLTGPTDDRALRQLYRTHYAGAAFVRIAGPAGRKVAMPEPKPLLGTNFCDIGVCAGEDPQTVIAVAALDNLMKGGAGNAVQCANLRVGADERAGLGFTGLFPI
jgi:LysW-gamma-L-alpha-aminoadipyl-6-phosphate/LysW-L-glutamyl-5-phosphate reductase